MPVARHKGDEHMGKLQIDTAIQQDGERLTCVLHKDWNIWGPNGGYVASVAQRAAGAVAPSDHRPATISVRRMIGRSSGSRAGAQEAPASSVESAPVDAAEVGATGVRRPSRTRRLRSCV